MKFRGIKKGAVISLYAVAVCTAANAQSVPADEELPSVKPQNTVTNSPIIVTARRREEALADVPISITVASQSDLEALAITDAESLGKLDPALVLANRQGSREVFTAFIRGQGAASSVGATQSVVTSFAEVPFFRPSFVDLDNIQVLKGPQGTLFGETATGGVVLFSPRRPSNDFEGYVSGEVGNYNYHMLEGAINIPVVDDVWSIRAAGQIRRRDGYTNLNYSQPGKTPTDGDDIDTSDFRLSSLFRPLDNLEVYTVIARNTFKTNGSGYILKSVYDRSPTMRALTPSNIPSMAAAYQFFSGQEPPAGLTYLQIIQNSLQQQLAAGPRTSFSSSPLDRSVKFKGIANQIKWDATDNITLRNITGLYRSSQGPNSGLNPDASIAPIADNIGAICVLGVSPADCREEGPLTFTNEFQVQANLLDNRLNFQTGFYYRKVSDAPWVGRSQFVVYASSTGNSTTLTRSASKSYAVYGQATFEAVDGVNITGGLRKSWDQTRTDSTTGAPVTATFQGFTIPLTAFGTEPLPGATVNTFTSPLESEISYNLSIDWQAADNILVWGSHRRGYKPGGVNRLVPVSDPRYLYGAEILSDFEVGIRAEFDLGGMPVQTSLVGYRGKYDDIQRSSFGVDSSSGAYIQLTQNVAAATIQGLEFSLETFPSEWFDFGGFIAYNDAGFDNWMETQTCSRQPFRAGCAGLASAVAAVTPVVIDHVAGTVTALGVTETFNPDAFAQAPEVRFNIRPAIHLGFLGESTEGATLSANISYTASHASADSNFTVGLADDDVITPGYTLVDLRFDWKDFASQPGLNFFAGVTNLFDKTYRAETTEVTSTCDCVFSIYGEPRMFYTGLKYSF